MTYKNRNTEMQTLNMASVYRRHFHTPKIIVLSVEELLCLFPLNCILKCKLVLSLLCYFLQVESQEQF